MMVFWFWLMVCGGCIYYTNDEWWQMLIGMALATISIIMAVKKETELKKRIQELEKDGDGNG